MKYHIFILNSMNIIRLGIIVDKYFDTCCHKHKTFDLNRRCYEYKKERNCQ